MQAWAWYLRNKRLAWLSVVFVLATVVFFWPPQRAEIKPEMLERPQRPPHPVEIYYPPTGR